jgi:hypothetical protein
VHLEIDTLSIDAPTAEIPGGYLPQTTGDLLGLFEQDLMTFYPSV